MAIVARATNDSAWAAGGSINPSPNEVTRPIETTS
jgi:hypothetical protein